MKIKVLFLCTGNSCRSQMAEGWAKKLKKESIEAYSAGIEKHGLNKNAVEVMQESGVDISNQSSKTTLELQGIIPDYVVTVCGHANESCPVFPAKTRVVHKGFEDPPALAKKCNTRQEALVHYRKIRDQIREFIESLPEALENSN